MGASRALIVVDLQKDFFPGGSLAVPEGDEIIPIINTLIQLPFKQKIASKDYHPYNHYSFAATHGEQVGNSIEIGGIKQILWPIHCVQGTKGAEFVPGLDTHHFDKVIFKGSDPYIDSYSTFYDNCKVRSTGLDEYLQGKGIQEIYLVGLATDYCVLYSALDALEYGYKVYVITDACRGVHPNDTQKALNMMQQKSIHLVKSQEVLQHFA